MIFFSKMLIGAYFPLFQAERIIMHNKSTQIPNIFLKHIENIYKLLFLDGTI